MILVTDGGCILAHIFSVSHSIEASDVLDICSHTSVGHGFLVRVSELCRKNGDSCENKNYGSTLDQFLGNFFHIFLSKIRKFIFHSFIHLSFIYHVSILIFHHYAIFLWLKFIFPMSTIKMILEHLVTWQLRKCTCMILALPATFNELRQNQLNDHFLS
eukprot:sb/3472941/